MAATKGQTLELAVLGLLHESPLHGYELRKRVNLLFGWSRLLSYGSLYPALKRMLRNNWIDEVTNTSISRRQRIVYQITPAGIEHFTQEIGDSGPASWRTTTSTCASPSSPAPNSTYACGSSKGVAPDYKSASTVPNVMPSRAKPSQAVIAMSASSSDIRSSRWSASCAG